MAKIMVIGGLHGDETLGIDLVKLLRDRPIPGVEAIVGNPMAAALQTRYIDRDLNRVFPGNPDGCLEELRATQIMKMVEGYELIIDFHSTQSQDNDCSFIGEGSDENTLKLSSALGLERVIIANYNCINKCLSNCLSVEISTSSDLHNPVYWYEKIAALTHTDIAALNPSNLQLFKFIDRVDGETYNKHKLSFENFKSISLTDMIGLNLSKELDLYPIFVNPNLFAGNYCALVEKTVDRLSFPRSLTL
jgi:hypothetical protein